MTDKAVYLRDYTAPEYRIEKTFLTFELHDGYTDVSSELHIVGEGKSPLVLHGEQLELLALSINNKALTNEAFVLDDKQLTIYQVPNAFVLQCQTRIYPERNTALEGLYRSNGMFCTQCEAEGFRKITYYLDRPDVMSEFETTLIADQGAFTTMLSNGNCVEDTLRDGKRIVRWHDPFKKPSYLFALVAGNLQHIEDTFTTASGRQVLLQIYVEAKDLPKCNFAMQSLKNAMCWDEQVYGREYDLDRFMIVAVDDFNMGAMENKGLNIFNTSCVLAHPKTTTDAAFLRVESVVAHEYFHNWSGNRVTCRDWFQLSLKEGLTVYRDSEFSAAMNSPAVKRIEDANFLRSVQFAEDAGPTAHPVRPESYIEISNFYTVTIYEKGAEVVRMLANILGADDYRRATDSYFARFDGQAVTCDDFIQCMQDVSGKDLSQFRLWYSQKGTPELAITESYDALNQRYSLTVTQHVPYGGLPMHIPLRLSLYGEESALPLVMAGRHLGTELVLDIRQLSESFVFENITSAPAPSLLRGFSAPVKLQFDYALWQLERLILLDNDGFSRWDAMQSLMFLVLNADINGVLTQADTLLQEIIAQLLTNFTQSDHALLALMLTLPNEAYLSEQYTPAAPLVIAAARERLQQTLASQHEQALFACYQALSNQVVGVQSEAMAARSLRNLCLHYLCALEKPAYIALAVQQFAQADDMTQQFAALKALVHHESSKAEAEQALTAFYQQFKDEPLVVNMWLQVQASCPWGDALARVHTLMQHAAFDVHNPNKLRSVIGAFCGQNFAAFHAENGAGYQFLAEQAAHIDQRNPQIASRLVGPLLQWRKFSRQHSELMKQALTTLTQDKLSKDMAEVVGKSLC